MAVIQNEQGINKPIKTDTSHVFDMNGNPLHGELFIGETIASEDVEEIDGYVHESDLAETEITLTATTSSSGVIATDLDYNLKIKRIYADDGSRKYYCLTRPSGQMKLVVVVLTEATTTLALVTNTQVTLHIFKADA